ncbi:NTP transferase domain-containing protein [Sphingosinicella xenopeptidilytica]|uniref:NTP transferase domain-containing protein n=1 Tax=Sphingosinicella xenopeptidilytica TaxID=364098 RepID=A0ABW3C1H1_SPHXN
MTSGFSAIVLAGKRDGRLDPLAANAGVSHKCLVPVAGKPMLLHVLEALDAAQGIGRIVVSIDTPEIIAPLIRQLGSGRIAVERSAPNLVDSVFGAANASAPPFLVTTADNVNLTSASIAEILATSHGAGAAVAFARRDRVIAAHPDGQRRFYRFRCGEYSNCNTYVLGSREALKAAEVFRGGGQFAKFPMRIVKAFGLLNLIRFRYGLATLDGAFRGFSRRFGLTIRPVLVSDGALAIDVDNERTLHVAETILGERGSALRQPPQEMRLDRAAHRLGDPLLA